MERRHALVAEIRTLEDCIVELRRRQGFLVGLLAGNVVLQLVDWLWRV